MRVSDERYRRDLRRLQVAWRMIRLEARTPTIVRWTTLTVYRVRRLRNAYAPGSSQHAALKGVTPTCFEFFFKSATLRSEAPMLAGFLRQFDVLPHEPSESVESLPGLGRGELFCDAYEQFRSCRPDTEITFEHAVMLLSELVRGVDIRLALCANCSTLLVQDCLNPRRPLCASCLRRDCRGLPYNSRQGSPSVSNQTPPEIDAPDGTPGLLF